MKLATYKNGNSTSQANELNDVGTQLITLTEQRGKSYQ